jgi:cyclase
MRIISRLDVKSEFLIKGVRFEGLRKLGNPAEFATRYFHSGIDEIFLFDNVASLYGRNHLGPLVESVAKDCFVPLTAAGGIRTVKDAEALFAQGADKVGINTAAFESDTLISGIADKFGAQAVVGSIQAKRRDGGWECLIEQGRERTGVELLERIDRLIDLGVGEIVVTSVDNDGVQSGFDVDLARAAVKNSSVPLVVGGGCGSIQHVLELIEAQGISGISIGSALHFDKLRIQDLKKAIRDTGDHVSIGNHAS